MLTDEGGSSLSAGGPFPVIVRWVSQTLSNAGFYRRRNSDALAGDVPLRRGRPFIRRGSGGRCQFHLRPRPGPASWAKLAAGRKTANRRVQPARYERTIGHGDGVTLRVRACRESERRHALTRQIRCCAVLPVAYLPRVGISRLAITFESLPAHPFEVGVNRIYYTAHGPWQIHWHPPAAPEKASGLPTSTPVPNRRTVFYAYLCFVRSQSCWKCNHWPKSSMHRYSRDRAGSACSARP